MRYELYPMMTRSGRGGIEQYDPATNLVALGGVGSNPSGLNISTSHKLFAPRVGLAYRLGNSTVVRAGFGISYDPMPLARPLRGWYPLTVSSLFTSANSFMPYAPLSQGIPAIPQPDFSQASLPLPLTAQVRYISNNEIKRGYTESWNFVIQRELPWHFLTSIAYVGTQTVHQFADLDVNAGVPDGGTKGQPLFAAYGRSAITWAWNGYLSANYHALQVSFDRRLYRHDIAGSIAHASALAAAGILTANEFEVIARALREIETEITDGNSFGISRSKMCI